MVVFRSYYLFNSGDEGRLHIGNGILKKKPEVSPRGKFSLQIASALEAELQFWLPFPVCKFGSR